MATSLEQIKVPAEAVAAPEEILKGEPDLSQDLLVLEYRYKVSAVEKREHELIVEKAMLAERKRYAAHLFILIAVWLVFIAFVIFFAGLARFPVPHLGDDRKFIFSIPFKLSDSVLIALISTSTANVLGLFYIVARWLFPNKLPEPSAKEPAPVATKPA